MASLLGGCMVLMVGAAQAAEHEVKMRNKGAEGMMVFEPAVLKIAPGDTVHFKATDKSHNVESVPGMLPDSAEPFVGKMNEDLTVTFAEPEVYGYRCKPPSLAFRSLPRQSIATSVSGSSSSTTTYSRS